MTISADDKTDEILTQKVGAGIPYAATYDGFGNLTSAPAPDGTSPNQDSSFDLADHLLSVYPHGSSTKTAFTIDALGRHWTRQVGTGATDTYTYAGGSAAVVRIASSTGTSTDSALDASAERLATKTSTGVF